jgi:hypothetical protein
MAARLSAPLAHAATAETTDLVSGEGSFRDLLSRLHAELMSRD